METNKQNQGGSLPGENQDAGTQDQKSTQSGGAGTEQHQHAEHHKEQEHHEHKEHHAGFDPNQPEQHQEEEHHEHPEHHQEKEHHSGKDIL